MSEAKKDKESVSIDYSKIPLQKGEVGRIIIIQQEDGGLVTLTKSPSNKQMSFPEAIGLLEIAKAEAMYSMRIKPHQGNGVNPDLLKDVTITLDELDLEMDVNGEMTKQGLGVGDTFPTTEFFSQMRDKRRKEYINQKERAE